MSLSTQLSIEILYYRSQRPTLRIEARCRGHVGNADQGEASFDSAEASLLLNEPATCAACPPCVIADVEDVGVRRVSLGRRDAVGAFIADLRDQGA